MFRLMLITDRHLSAVPPDEIVKAAVSGGVDAVQVREKDLAACELLALTERIIAAVGDDVRVIVNDRVDVALAAGAGGAHLGGASVPVLKARALAPEGFLLGYSAHSIDEALAAGRDGADYVTFSPVFATACKPDARPLGLHILSEAAGRLAIPVVALGGITPQNAPEVIRGGASAVAVISSIYCAADPKAAACALKNAIDQD